MHLLPLLHLRGGLGHCLLKDDVEVQETPYLGGVLPLEDLGYAGGTVIGLLSTLDLRADPGQDLTLDRVKVELPAHGLHRDHLSVLVGKALLVNQGLVIEDFIAPHGNFKINYFYLTHMDQFDKFILEFNEKAKHLIDKAANERFNVILDSDTNFLHEYSDTMPNRNHVKNFIKNRLNIHLTHREIDCVKWLILGKTIPDTASLLNISKRTVEKYTASIKEKLNCYSLFQLGQKISKIGIDDLVTHIRDGTE